ncbi:MAG: putative 2-dehydropantoate 2-reductase [Desulfuromonadaceae bacterium]|nr:putative 2-dehydropantoate 2-reductase [Desulfuromonadaceae bacterium]MDD2849109.1 putative 2-dehydropantoate 2-reductase [Desulfuromonadaceae bacterium]MDD4129477.1 putative 2-dehydropantoate 2-reductase [Desulfuromonadaceae bacterium]
MKIAIIGSGALGLYYGAMLQRSGHEVHFLLRRDYEAITSNGLTVHSVNGDFCLPVVSGHRTPDTIGPVELVIVGLKTFANNHLYDLVSPLVATETQILTLQNGLGNEELLAELFGAERILGGVAFLCSNRGESGHVHHLGGGRIIIGEYEQRDNVRLVQIVSAFSSAGIECKATGDLKKARWEKLVWNIPFNGLCALLQQSVDKLLKVNGCRKLVRDLMVEVIAAANTQDLSQVIPEAYADEMLEFSDGMGEYKPSMQIDREEGRTLEIEAILRVPLGYGRQHGVDMLRTEMLAVLLEQGFAAGPF